MLPTASVILPSRGTTLNMLGLSMKEKKNVALPDESSFGDVISNKDMKECNLMEIPSLKGIQLYNITLV